MQAPNLVIRVGNISAGDSVFVEKLHGFFR